MCIRDRHNSSDVNLRNYNYAFSRNLYESKIKEIEIAINIYKWFIKNNEIHLVTRIYLQLTHCVLVFCN